MMKKEMFEIARIYVPVKRRATLEDSMAAVDIKLTSADFDELEAAAPVGGTAGPRYGETMMSMVRL